MTDQPHREDNPRPTPGFVACGAMVLLALIGFGVIAGGIAAITSSTTRNTLISIVAVAGVLAAVVQSVRDPRFGACLVKGLAAVTAFAVIVFGACVAIIAGSGI
jgi:hypothetical protein